MKTSIGCAQFPIPGVFFYTGLGYFVTFMPIVVKRRLIWCPVVLAFGNGSGQDNFWMPLRNAPKWPQRKLAKTSSVSDFDFSYWKKSTQTSSLQDITATRMKCTKIPLVTKFCLPQWWKEIGFLRNVHSVAVKGQQRCINASWVLGKFLKIYLKTQQYHFICGE